SGKVGVSSTSTHFVLVAERARFELANGARPLRHFQCGLRKPPRSLAAGLLSSWNRRGVDVELVEPPIRVVPSAVRVVSPGRMRDPAVERQARVITIVDVVTGVMRV